MTSKCAQLFGAVLLVLSAALPSTALAYDWSADVKVVSISVERVGVLATTTPYVAIMFQPDTPVGACGNGVDALAYVPMYFGGAIGDTQTNEGQRQLANQKAVLSALQISLMLGTKVRIQGYNSGCQVARVMSLNN